MAEDSKLTCESFVRDLPFTPRKWLIDTLDTYDTWEKLAANIPLNYNDLLCQPPVPFEARYAARNLFSFRKHVSPTTNLLEDWEIENCRIKHLIQALLNAGLIEAANQISSHCSQPALQAPQASQPPSEQRVGQGQHQQASQPTNDTDLQEEVLVVNGGKKCAVLKDVPPEPSICIERPQGKDNSGDVPNTKSDEQSPFNFELLRRITGNFDMREKTLGGHHIGTGGFGDVFFGQFWDNKVAVKCLRNNEEESLKQFETEVKALCAYKHENLVTLLGYCSDGHLPCLVYEYVVNGSLEDRLACYHGTLPLSVTQRLDIAIGTARGIEYLHGKGVVHRDIKSANILLDEDYKPKVSDFATARTLQKTVDTECRMTQKTQTLIGTTCYLDPEAFSYEIYPGLDIYSFGVVILELLTGLPVFDEKRENEDLKVYIQEYCTPYVPDEEDDEEEDNGLNNEGTIFDLVDKKAGVVWNSVLVEELYALSKKCLAKRKEREKIDSMLKKLNDMTDSLVDGVDLPEK